MTNFERLHQYASHNMLIQDFSSFCKRVHDLDECKTLDCEIGNFSMVLSEYMRKEKSVSERKEFFLSQGKTFSSAFNSLSAMNSYQKSFDLIQILKEQNRNQNDFSSNQVNSSRDGENN